MGSHGGGHSGLSSGGLLTTVGTVIAGPLGGAIGGALGFTKPGQKAAGQIEGLVSPPKPTAAVDPAAPAQAHDAVTTVGGFNMDLAQKMAASANNTIFSTPSQWWNQRISNQGSPGSQLVGA